jgi:general secretion pathway protein F
VKFQYEAARANGKRTRGVLDASDEAAALTALTAQGLTPLSIALLAADAPRQAKASARVGRAHVTLATRQLAHLVEAGVPVPDAYATVAAQTPQAPLRHALTHASQRLRQGDTLHGALDAHPKLFPPLYRALIAAGGESGQLGKVMSQLADYLDARDALTQKLTTALIYPALVACVSFAVVLAMVTYVMPQVVAVFAQGKQTLPWITRVLIAASAFLKNNALLLTLLALLGVALTWAFAHWPRTREAWDRLVLRLPIIGGFAREVDLTRFLQTLAMLSAAGVPLLSAFAAARKVVQRAPLAQAVAIAENMIAQGSAITPALQATGQFPPMVLQLTANGESTGQLPAMLDRAARLSQQAVERRAGWLTALIEPALIVVMGGVVLVLVLAVMMPIVSINTLIK